MPAIPARSEEGKVDAQTFADNNRFCGNGGFTVSVSSKLSVIGGTGHIDGNCVIELIFGSKISFKDVTLTGSGTFTIQGGNHASIDIKDSSFTIAEFVRLRSGCCAAMIGDKSKVKISGSTITSSNSSININAADSWTGGKVDIKSSTVDAGGGPGDFVDVKASAAGTKGSVKVSKESTLDATGAALNVITNDGKTSVTDSTLAGTPITITAGSLGKCKSDGNTPVVPCT